MISDLNKLYEAGKKYLEVRIELLKLDARDQLSHYFVKFSFLVGGGLLVLSVLLFLALGLAFYINEVFQSNYLGFFIVAGIFFFVMVLIISLRNNKAIQRIFQTIIDFFIFD
jgi:hypothetical protein